MLARRRQLGQHLARPPRARLATPLALLFAVLGLLGCEPHHCDLHPEHCLGECGDGVVHRDEDCDDGNDSNLDGCSTVCTLLPERPDLALAATPIKQLELYWGPVAGASFYQLLSARHGGEFQQLGPDIPAESLTLEVPLHLHIDARYQLLACNAERCAASGPVRVADELEQAIGYFKASNTGAYDLFRIVALSGDGLTMAVGADQECSGATGVDGDPFDDSVSNAGAVYVFVHEHGAWSQQAYLKASNTGWYDGFGGSLALSNDGDTLVVGAPYESSANPGVDAEQANDNATASGAVYVFVRAGSSWSQQTYIKAVDVQSYDTFGISVALAADGDTLAVGAPGEDGGAVGVNGNPFDNSRYESGAAYVFARDGQSWSQQAYVKASNPSDSDQFGFDVKLANDGHTLAVSAPYERSSATGIDGDQTDDSLHQAGAVYLFAHDGQSWSQQAYVKPSMIAASDAFGTRVALSGDGLTLAVGASGDNTLTPELEGGLVGATHVFVRDGSSWSQQAFIQASNADSGDHFGQAIALSDDGSILAVGAVYEYGGAGIGGAQTDNSLPEAGAVYVLERIDGAWVQRSYVKSAYPSLYQRFGGDVALSGDGLTLAVAAANDHSSATGIGGDPRDLSAYQSGAVWLY